jgi:hypothetical protein
MKLLLKDGIKYLPYPYKDEAELEQKVVDHYEVIFGKNAVLFQKQKISAHSGIGTIPDGFVLLIGERKWYIVEVELSTHSYDHFVIQMNRFTSAIRNPTTRGKLIKAFYDETNDDIQLRYKFEAADITRELYKFLSDTISSTDPEIIIVIDERNKDLDEACDNLSFQTSILEFKTFYREGVEDAKVSIHFFDTLKEYEEEKPKIRGEKKLVKPGPSISKGVSKTLMDILDVATIVFYEGKSYTEAVKIVASRRNVTQQTIMDHCARRIGKNTEEFKALLEDKEQLISFLKGRFPKNADGKIINDRLKRSLNESR